MLAKGQSQPFPWSRHTDVGLSVHFFFILFPISDKGLHEGQVGLDSMPQKGFKPVSFEPGTQRVTLRHCVPA